MEPGSVLHSLASSGLLGYTIGSMGVDLGALIIMKGIDLIDFLKGRASKAEIQNIMSKLKSMSPEELEAYNNKIAPDPKSRSKLAQLSKRLKMAADVSKSGDVERANKILDTSDYLLRDLQYIKNDDRGIAKVKGALK